MIMSERNLKGILYTPKYKFNYAKSLHPDVDVSDIVNRPDFNPFFVFVVKFEAIGDSSVLRCYFENMSKGILLYIVPVSTEISKEDYTKHENFKKIKLKYKNDYISAIEIDGVLYLRSST